MESERSAPQTESGQPKVEAAGGPRRRRRWLVRAGTALLLLFGLIQLLPIGRSGNPPVSRAVVWPDSGGQALAAGACYDCHSNLTKRWWATKIAPASWLAENDVNGGRAHLDFSRWDTPQPALKDVVEVVRSGSMPPLQYRLIHGDSRLSDRERKQLIAALTGLYTSDPPAILRRGGGAR